MSKARREWRRFLRVVREIVGAPDYERYVEHQTACHPGEPPLSPRAYYAEFVTRQCGSGGGGGGGAPTRCC
jgi:uncharacterized short protein YbdD (DUF466 family)